MDGTKDGLAYSGGRQTFEFLYGDLMSSNLNKNPKSDITRANT